MWCSLRMQGDLVMADAFERAGTSVTAERTVTTTNLRMNMTTLLWVVSVSASWIARVSYGLNTWVPSRNRKSSRPSELGREGGARSGHARQFRRIRERRYNKKH